MLVIAKPVITLNYTYGILLAAMQTQDLAIHQLALQLQRERAQHFADRAELQKVKHTLELAVERSTEDMTLCKQAELEIKQALAKQEELNRLKTSFISTVSHELRAPLTTILSAAEILEHIVCSPSLEQQLFCQIKDTARQLNKLLEDVLLIGRTEAEEIKSQTTCFDALQLMRTLVRDFKISESFKNPILIRGKGKSTLVQLDKKLLRQILSNLLENAIKYSPENSPIQLKFTCFKGKAVFQIQDKGIGIPPEDIPHLFECLYRGSNVGRISGRGLGLAIVKQCVDLHRGKITVDSVVGRGTSFTVTLPQRKMTSLLVIAGEQG